MGGKLRPHVELGLRVWVQQNWFMADIWLGIATAKPLKTWRFPDFFVGNGQGWLGVSMISCMFLAMIGYFHW